MRSATNGARTGAPVARSRSSTETSTGQRSEFKADLAGSASCREQVHLRLLRRDANLLRRLAEDQGLSMSAYVTRWLRSVSERRSP